MEHTYYITYKTPEEGTPTYVSGIEGDDFNEALARWDAQYGGIGYIPLTIYQENTYSKTSRVYSVISDIRYLIEG